MKQLTDAFAFIFSDNEWFNKILVGGFYFLLIPVGIGMIMINGYLLTFSTAVRNNESNLPYWRKYHTIFFAGLRTGIISYIFLIVCMIILIASDYPLSIPKMIALISIFLTLNAVLITKSINALGLLVSLIFLIASISLGWMFIVVGWTLLIFLALLVQVFLFSKNN